jgi:hypothetical protein
MILVDLKGSADQVLGNTELEINGPQKVSLFQFSVKSYVPFRTIIFGIHVVPQALQNIDCNICLIS